MTDTNLRLQNLRDFTVQVCNAKDEIVGTGIAVSAAGNRALQMSTEVGYYWGMLDGQEILEMIK
jgi:hypothetical protein